MPDALPTLGTALFVGAAVMAVLLLDRDFGPGKLTRLAGGFLVLLFLAFTDSPGGINVLYGSAALFVLLAMLGTLFGPTCQE